jgi:hypothetical protein
MGSRRGPGAAHRHRVAHRSVAPGDLSLDRPTPLPTNRDLFVRVETDEGIVGLVELGAWAFLEASAAAIEKFGTVR